MIAWAVGGDGIAKARRNQAVDVVWNAGLGVDLCLITSGIGSLARASRLPMSSAALVRVCVWYG